MGSDLIVTNFNKNFTGVSATCANVARLQTKTFAMYLAGHGLPNCPKPISARQAVKIARQGPKTKPFQIWHVRRNSEMRTALYARDILRLPIKIVFTSAAQRRHSALPRFLISRMDAVIATTDAAASYVDNVWAVAPHGVDTDIFTPAQNSAKAWQKTGYLGTRGIACVGRIRPEKGTDLFVDAMIKALPALEGATALVIGEAKGTHQNFLQSLRQKIEAAGLTDRIIFTGEIKPSALPATLQGLSLLVALPRYEGYGMTPLEAMACGVPVVASDTGYFRQFLGEGEAGNIVPLESPQDAGKHIAQILGDTALQAKLATGAVNRAREHFSIQKEVAAINAVYEQLWAKN